MHNFYFPNFIKTQIRISFHRMVLLSATIIFFLFSFPVVSELKAQTDLFSDMKFKGDFRFRFENTSNAEPNSVLLEGRNRLVVRFRYGFTKNQDFKCQRLSDAARSPECFRDGASGYLI